MTTYIDTHAHYCDEAYSDDADLVIARARQAGVVKIIHPDVDARERDAMFALCAKYPGFMFPMLGLYPGSVTEDWEDDVALLESYAGRDIVAIGEIGLDYHYSPDSASLQKKALRAQFELASRLDLPVNIHLRDATEDFISVLREVRHLGLRGNLHAFSLSAETYRQISRLGDWYVGIGGVVTFKNAKVALSLKEIPLDRIVLETDAPYLTPVPMRGRRNESSYLPLIAEKIASIKGIGVEEVAAATTSTAEKLFKI